MTGKTCSGINRGSKVYEKPSYESLIGTGEIPTIWIFFGQSVLVSYQILCLDLWTESQKECVQPVH